LVCANGGGGGFGGGGGGFGGGGDGFGGSVSSAKNSRVISSHRSSLFAQNTCLVFVPPPHVLSHALQGPTSQWW
jgi:hypothetical protein